MKLRAKTSILISVMAIALIAIVGGASLQYQERALRENIIAGVDAVAATASLNVASFVRDGQHSAALIAAAVPRQPLIDGRGLDQVERTLKESMALAPFFRNGLFILDVDGHLLVDHPVHPEVHGESFAYRDYYKRVIREWQTVVSEPYISKRTGAPVITFSVPIMGADGKLLAVLGCSVNLLDADALGAVIKQRISKTGYLYVMDHSRQMILHPDQKMGSTHPRF